MLFRSHWFNHLLLSPDDGRFIFLHRYWRRVGGPERLTRMLTADAGGGSIRLVNPEPMTSHFDWYDDRRIVAWASYRGEDGYWLFDEGTGEATAVGRGVFGTDGHCGFSPDRRWMLTDSYPDPVDSKRMLMAYGWPEGPRVDLGRFFSPSPSGEPMRCDLHPRWRPDGGAICFDSMHEGVRRMYVLECGGISGSRGGLGRSVTGGGQA